MRILLTYTLTLVSLCFIYTQIASAVCVEGPANTYTCNANAPNPDPDGIQQQANNNGVNVTLLPNGNIDTSVAGGGSGNNAAIRLGNGNNNITINNASVIGEGDAIGVGDGADQITVNNSIVRSPVDTILLRDQDDNFQLTNSTVTASDNSIAVDLEGGNDTAVIDNSTITAVFDVAFLCGSGNDNVTIRSSTILTTDGDPFPLECGDDDDTITLAGIAPNVPGGIDCDDGEGDNAAGFDTLIFAMDVPTNQIGEITQQIESLPTPDGSITINNIFYEYRNCDVIEADLSGGFSFPVPTLSQWGLIAMAGLLGIIGFLVICRRQLTTNS